ncbi:MAG: hypothetical protein ACD_62C00558G0002 [uncultured bacterium]|nr:MAG: hypothetical protein ACD_62C00558G0002 [uncultured bacterium]
MLRDALNKKILTRLVPIYAKQPMGINYETPFQLVVGTILSAQCTDKRVNQVTATFFDRLRDPQDFLKLSQKKLEELIKPTGFFRNKAKNILGAAKTIHFNYQGVIPKTLKELLEIPGFGRKTANVVLNRLYGINEGICVDTHVLRLAHRLGLSAHTDAVRVEKDLMQSTPKGQWGMITHCLILHGRAVCLARGPKCGECVLRKICPKKSLALSGPPCGRDRPHFNF